MFDWKVPIGLEAGGSEYVSAWSDADFEDRALLLTLDELASGWSVDDRYLLPDLESLPVGPFLSVLLDSLDRSRLNGFDLVRAMQARERLVSHFQAASVADVHEIAHAAPGTADPGRLDAPSEFAADELRPALRITRRAAELRLSVAFDLCERLPRVWEMLSSGLIDLAKARVIANGTAHLEWEEARVVAETVSERAPRLTAGQLAAWIRRLCVESDPEKAKKRREQAFEDRRLVIEPTVDGTAHLHMYDMDLADAPVGGEACERPDDLPP